MLLKNIVYSAAVLLAFNACQKPDYGQRNEKNGLADIYATIEGKATDRLFNSTFANDTFFVNVDYYYPIDSDNEVNLKRMLLRASLPADAKITPGLNGFIDLSEPRTLTVTSGTGDEQNYVVKALKRGSTALNKVTITVGADVVEGIIAGKTVTFFVLPGIDVSKVKLEYVINKHSTGSIVNGSAIDLGTGSKVFSVSAPGDAKSDYTFVVKEPVKKERGLGISRRLFVKTAAELGFSANNETSLFVSGDYVVIVTRSNPSVFKVYNRFTGVFSHSITSPLPGGRLSFQGIGDGSESFAITSYTPANSAFIVYRYNNVNDKNPVKLLEWTNAKPATVPGDGSIGRKVAWAGSLTGKGVMTASLANSRFFYEWRMENGLFTSTQPVLKEYKDGEASLGFLAEYVPMSANEGANYIASANTELVYLSGASYGRIATFPTVPNTMMNNSIAYVRFNNADIVAQLKLIEKNDNSQMFIYDITNRSLIGTSISAPNYNDLRVYQSELFLGNANLNATGDICVGTSENGERLQVYMLSTFGYLVCHEFTTYAD